MAKAKETASDPVTVQEEKATEYISRYTIEELSNAARTAFNCDPILAKAALKVSGKNEYSLEEAKKIIKQFIDKEVRD